MKRSGNLKETPSVSNIENITNLFRNLFVCIHDIHHFPFASSVFKMARKCLVHQTSKLIKGKALVQSTSKQ